MKKRWHLFSPQFYRLPARVGRRRNLFESSPQLYRVVLRFSEIKTPVRIARVLWVWPLAEQPLGFAI